MDPRLIAFAQWMVSEWNGRTTGRTTGYALNFDRRFGNQCMDLWNWTWTFLGIPSNAVKRTYDAAGVWELPADEPIWEYFDGILPAQMFQPGDTFVYNRSAFGAQGRGAGNGYGHIGMVVQDNGDGTIQVLEANGLGDGYEDEYLNQYGSPARLHTWSKADLYGVLRPIPSKCPGLSNFAGAASIMPAGTITPTPTPTPKEEGFLMALTDKQQQDLYDWVKIVHDRVTGGIPAGEARDAGDIGRNPRLADSGDIYDIKQMLAKTLNTDGGNVLLNAIAEASGKTINQVTKNAQAIADVDRQYIPERTADLTKEG